MDWETRVSELWSSIDAYAPEAFRERLDELLIELPGDSPVRPFEQASALDSTGHSDRAVPLYREALRLGLTGVRRRRAVIQLASSLRNVGHVAQSVALLEAEHALDLEELRDEVSAFLALALVDSGREREAVSILLTALAPHLTRYQRSAATYARRLVGDDG